jgi:hypothetical protein
MQRNPPSGAVVALASYPANPGAVEVNDQYTLDWSKGPIHTLTLMGPTAIHSVGLPAGEAVGGLICKLIQGGGPNPPPHGVLFVGAKTPGGQGISVSATPTAIDVVGGFWDGANLWINLLGRDWGS